MGKGEFIQHLRAMLADNHPTCCWRSSEYFFLDIEDDDFLNLLQVHFKHKSYWVITRALGEYGYGFELKQFNGEECYYHPHFTREGGEDHLIKFCASNKSNKSKVEEDTRSLQSLADVAVRETRKRTPDNEKANEEKKKVKEKSFVDLLVERNELQKQVDERKIALVEEIKMLKEQLKVNL